MPPKTDLKMIKQINLVKIFQTVRAKGPISRADVAKLINLSPTTVSTLVEELIGMGLLESTGVGKSSGGRRPLMLLFRPNARLTIGVDINEKSIAVGCCDLDGNVTHKTSFAPDYSSKKNLVAGTIYGINQILQQVDNDTSKILGIGIAIPGLLDKERTSLIYSASLDVSNIPLIAELEQYLKLPIRLENDMNAAAFGESLLGAGRNTDNLVYISVARGIGAGVIIDNKIFAGGSGNAGELGHMNIDPNGPICECGNKGCLGVLATEPALLSKTVHMLSLSTPTKLKSLTHSNISNVSLDLIAQAVREQDAAALAILRETMDYLGIGITNLLSLFDPSLIILGGDIIERFGDSALHYVRQCVTNRNILPNHMDKRVRIVKGDLGEDVKLIGAASLIFSDFLTTLKQEQYHTSSS